MKIVITGGTGFIGGRLAEALLERGRLTGADERPAEIDELVLFDAHVPDRRLEKRDSRVRIVQGEISDKATLRKLIDREDISIFHLASVVSGQGERDFDLAMRVNIDGSRALLEACRALSAPPRLVFASSIAVFGGSGMPPVIGDTVKQTPQTTYGMTKAVVELLVNDYTRKGFIDGRSARLPTVIIRPGKPNAAASSFFSSLFREPLNGEDYALPVGMEVRHPVTGYRNVVDGIIAMHELEGAAIGDDRAVCLPAVNITVGELVAALERVAGNRPLGRITTERDPFIEDIVARWPTAADSTRALELGLPAASSIDEIVNAYIQDYVEAAHGAEG